MKRTLFAMVAASATVLLQCVSVGGFVNDDRENLLKQPTFEARTWDSKWFGNHGTVATDQAELHEGHPSLRIEQGTPAGVAFLNQKIPCKPLTHYRFSGWIKATKMVLPKEQEAKPAGAALAVFPGLGNSGWLSDTGTWVHASVDFRTKAGQTEVQLGPRIGFNEWRPSGTAWFADLLLIEVK